MQLFTEAKAVAAAHRSFGGGESTGLPLKVFFEIRRL